MLAPAMMTTTTAAQTTVRWHHWLSSTCSRNDDNGGGCSMEDSALALLVIPPSLARATTAAAVVRMTVLLIVGCPSLACLLNNGGASSANDGPRHRWWSIACSCTDEDNCGCADNGASASSAVLHMLTQQQRGGWRHGQWCLGIVGLPSLAQSCNDGGSDGAYGGALALLGTCRPLAAAAAVVRMTLPWHHWWSVACLRHDGSSGGADNNALASSTVCPLLVQLGWEIRLEFHGIP